MDAKTLKHSIGHKRQSPTVCALELPAVYRQTPIAFNQSFFTIYYQSTRRITRDKHQEHTVYCIVTKLTDFTEVYLHSGSDNLSG